MTAYLVLSDGKVFEGESIGDVSEACGELNFTTNVCYMNTLKNPAYYGQIVVCSFPIIGSYGVVASEGVTPRLKGLVVRELIKKGSNFAMEEELESYLVKHKIPGICGVDTRELTRYLRDNGSKSAVIVNTLKNVEDKLKNLKKHKIDDAVETLSVKNIDFFGQADDRRVVVVDLGKSDALVQDLAECGYYVIRVPYDTTAEEVMKLEPAVVAVSDGTGDPSQITGVKEQLKKINAKGVKVFGIGLGHIALGLSYGGSYKKHKYGHHGGQPVKDLENGRIYITSQSHNFIFLAAGVSAADGKISMVNANDKTVAGMRYKNGFSIDFYHKPSGNTLDGKEFLKRFVELAGGNFNA